jgi:hypothetical protein
MQTNSFPSLRLRLLSEIILFTLMAEVTIFIIYLYIYIFAIFDAYTLLENLLTSRGVPKFSN